MKKYTTTITINLETRNTQVIQHLINRINKTKFKSIFSLKVSSTTPNSIEIPDDEKTTQRRKLLKLRSTQRKILKTIINQLDFKPVAILYEPNDVKDIIGYQASLHSLLLPQTTYYDPPVSITIDDNMSKIAITMWGPVPVLVIDLADPTFIEQINRQVRQNEKIQKLYTWPNG